MKVVLSSQEVETILVSHVNEKFDKAGFSTKYENTRFAVDENGVTTWEAFLKDKK